MSNAVGSAAEGVVTGSGSSAPMSSRLGDAPSNEPLEYTSLDFLELLVQRAILCNDGAVQRYVPYLEG